MSIESEMAELRQALELPTAGQLRRGGDLAELNRLIGKYTDEAAQIIAEMDGPDRDA